MSPYEFDGEKYKKASKHQKEWGNRLIAQLHLKGNESILDLGCGDGVLTEQLSFLVPDGRVLGIDASLLRNAYCALKPDGILLWNFAGSGNCSYFFETVRKIMAEENYRPFFQHFEWPWFMPCKTEYEELASSVGFRQFSVTEEIADRTFADADEMIRWIDQPSLVPFIQYVPEEKKEAFRKEVIEEMLRQALRPDGACFETFRRIRVNALK